MPLGIVIILPSTETIKDALDFFAYVYKYFVDFSRPETVLSQLQVSEFLVYNGIAI